MPPDSGAPQWPDATYPAGYPHSPGSGPLPPQQQYPPTVEYPAPPYYPPPPFGPTLPASGAFPPPPLPPPPPTPPLVAPRYSQPVYGQVPYAPPVDPGGGAAIAALVLGIISLPMMFFSVCDLPIVIAGVICGVIGMQRSTQRRGMAITGLALSLAPVVIAIAVGIIALVARSPQPA